MEALHVDDAKVEMGSVVLRVDTNGSEKAIPRRFKILRQCTQIVVSTRVIWLQTVDNQDNRKMLVISGVFSVQALI